MRDSQVEGRVRGDTSRAASAALPGTVPVSLRTADTGTRPTRESIPASARGLWPVALLRRLLRWIQPHVAQTPRFLHGWTLFTVIQTGTSAAVAVAFAKSAEVLFP